MSRQAERRGLRIGRSSTVYPSRRRAGDRGRRPCFRQINASLRSSSTSRTCRSITRSTAANRMQDSPVHYRQPIHHRQNHHGQGRRDQRQQGCISLSSEATFYKKPNDWTVKIASKYNRQYTGGGDEGLDRRHSRDDEFCFAASGRVIRGRTLSRRSICKSETEITRSAADFCKMPVRGSGCRRISSLRCRSTV